MLRAIIGFFAGLFRRRSDRRNTDSFLREIEQQNDRNKNVIEFRAVPLEALLPDSTAENAVISGTNGELRARAVCAAAWRCHEEGRPAVILHCGNERLAAALRGTFRGAEGFACIDSGHRVYDPFVGRDRAQIVRFAIAASDDEHKIGQSGGMYLYGLCDYLMNTGRTPCVAAFSDCFESRAFENLENGNLSVFIAQRINTELKQGFSQAGEAEHFFQSLRSQAGSILAPEGDIREALSIRSAVRGNSVVALDIGNAANSLLLNAVMQELRDVAAEGARFTLLLESVPVDAAKTLGAFLRTFAGGCSFFCSSANFYADTQGEENVFSTLLGKSGSVIVLRHAPGQACAKFSDYFGTYQKAEVSRTIVQGDTYNSFTQILPGSSTSGIIGVQHADRPRVESNEIAVQAADHAFIQKNGEIYSARIAGGDAKTRAELPRGGTLRPASQNAPRARSRFNVLIFILLLFFPPFAFVYSLAVCGRRGKIISAVLLVLTVIALVVFALTVP